MKINHPLTRLLAGNVLAQAIIFAATPLLSRFYTAETIGLWSVTMVIINVLWSFSQLRTDIALFQAGDETERTGLFQIGVIAHSIFTIVALLLVWGMGIIQVAHWWMWGLLFAVIAAFGYQQMAISWMASKHLFQQQNKLRLLGAIISYPGGLLLYWLGGENMLFVAIIVGSLWPALVLLKESKVYRPFSDNGWKYYVKLLHKHQKTSTLLPLGNLLLSLADQGLVLLIARQYSAEEAAACFLAMRISGAPLSMIQTVVGQYNYRHFQDLFDQGRFTPAVIFRQWIRWSIPTLLFFLPIIALGPEVFMLLLGKNWKFAGELAVILGPLAAVKLLVAPTSMGFFIIGKQTLFFAFSVLLFLAVPISYGISCYGGTIQFIILVVVVYQLIVYLLYNVTMIYYIRHTLYNK